MTGEETDAEQTVVCYNDWFEPKEQKNNCNKALTETNLTPCQIDTDQARVLSNRMKLSSFNLTGFQLDLSQLDRTLIQFDKGKTLVAVNLTEVIASTP
jgi:hypothetical protein